MLEQILIITTITRPIGLLDAIGLVASISNFTMFYNMWFIKQQEYSPYVTFLHYCIILCNKSMICDFTMLCNLQFLNLQECFHMLLFLHYYIILCNTSMICDCTIRAGWWISEVCAYRVRLKHLYIETTVQKDFSQKSIFAREITFEKWPKKWEIVIFS